VFWRNPPLSAVERVQTVSRLVNDGSLAR
jgi:hypothetical protein